MSHKIAIMDSSFKDDEQPNIISKKKLSTLIIQSYSDIGKKSQHCDCCNKFYKEGLKINKEGLKLCKHHVDFKYLKCKQCKIIKWSHTYNESKEYICYNCIEFMCKLSTNYVLDRKFKYYNNNYPIYDIKFCVIINYKFNPNSLDNYKRFIIEKKYNIFKRQYEKTISILYPFPFYLLKLIRSDCNPITGEIYECSELDYEIKKYLCNYEEEQNGLIINYEQPIKLKTFSSIIKLTTL